MKPDDKIKAAIAAKLIRYRKAHHLTQAKMAVKLETKLKNLAAYEEQRATPPVSVIGKLCDLMNVQLKELIS